MNQEQQLILVMAGFFIPLFITLGAIAYDMNRKSKKELTKISICNTIA